MGWTAEEVIKRFSDASKRKTFWDKKYKEAISYVAPGRQLYHHYYDGQNKSEPNRVFDDTAVDALDGFISNLQGGLCPSGKRWMDLNPGPGVNVEPGQSEALQEICDVFFEALSNSNFDSEMSGFLGDLAFGVGSLLFHKGTKEKPFRFEAVPIPYVQLERGAYGDIDVVFRKCKVPYRAVGETWEDAQVGEELRKKILECPNEDGEFIEVVYPEFRDFTDLDGVKIKRKGYVYQVVSMLDETELVYRQLWSNPWIVARWQPLAGEVWARGPAVKALPTIMCINKVKYLLLLKGSVDTVPKYMALDNSVVNLENMTWEEIEVVPVEYTAGGPRGPSIVPFPRSGGDLNLSQFMFNEMRATINKVMFAEPLGPVDGAVKTATEIATRASMLAKRMGPLYGSLQQTVLKPIVWRGLYILNELGLIDLDVFLFDSGLLKLEYLSPLAIAQKQEELLGIKHYLELLSGVLGPELALLSLKIPKLLDEVCTRLDIPKSITQDTQVLASLEEMLQAKFGLGSLAQGVQVAGQMGLVGQQAATMMQNVEGVA